MPVSADYNSKCLNNRGFPYLRKSEGKGKMATRIGNKSWADDQNLEESLQNYSKQGLQRK